MRIKEIIVVRVTLPFTGEFSHSLRRRFSVNNIVVILMGYAGEVLGCGEGAPRPYVTGETSEISEKYVKQLINKEDFPWEVESVAQIWEFIDSLPVGKEMNASICAIEMALLDGFARFKRMQVIDFFPHNHYTAPYSSESV